MPPATCTAMVHHGGNGTTPAGLGAGVRHLVLPGGADGHEAARILRARGVGMASSPEAVDADLLRHLLTDDAMPTAAAEVRDETAALSSPATIVPRLEQPAGTAPHRAPRTAA